MSRRAAALSIAAIAFVACIRVASTYRVFCETIDEPVHIAAGLQWLDSPHYNLELEHPPLARIGFAIGSYFSAHAKRDPSLSPNEQGTAVLFTNDRYRHNLALARVANLPWLILAVVVAGLWATFLFGRATGVVAAALFSMLPPVLGHAGVSTTDMAATATIGFALYAFDRWLAERTLPRMLLLAFAIGLGIVCKHSFAPYFLPAAIVLIAIRISDRRSPPATSRQRPARYALQCVAVIAIPIFMLSAAYKFDTGRINDTRIASLPKDYPQNIAARFAKEPGYGWVRADLVKRYYDYCKVASTHYVDFVDWAKAAGYPSPKAGRNGNTMADEPPPLPVSLRDRVLEPVRASMQWVATNVRVPAPEYFVGLNVVSIHTSIGHRAYLFGRQSDHGWWYYFPALILFKTPIAFLIFFAIGIVLRPRLAIVPLIMLLPAIASGINIGIRHVLPIYVPMTLTAAYGAAHLWQKRRAIACVLAAWLLLANALAHPDYLANFNELALGHPERIATDSNLDWGQDGLRLADYAKRHHLAPLHVTYFGTPDLHRFGADFDDLIVNQRVKGWVAISEMKIAFNPGYKWLDRYPIKRRIGKSIRLYYFE